jgi:hypothetical protein
MHGGANLLAMQRLPRFQSPILYRAILLKLIPLVAAIFPCHGRRAML